MYNLLIPIYEKHRKSLNLDAYNDFTYMDKKSLSDYPGWEKYLWVLTDCATTLIKLESMKQSFFPPNFDFNTLVGKIKEKKFGELGTSVLFNARTKNPTCIVYYYNGEKVKKISIEKAKDLLLNWQKTELFHSLELWQSYWNYTPKLKDVKNGLLKGLTNHWSAVFHNPVIRQIGSFEDLYKETKKPSYAFNMGYDIKTIQAKGIFEDETQTSRITQHVTPLTVTLYYHIQHHYNSKNNVGGYYPANIWYWFKVH